MAPGWLLLSTELPRDDSRHARLNRSPIQLVSEVPWKGPGRWPGSRSSEKPRSPDWEILKRQVECGVADSEGRLALDQWERFLSAPCRSLRPAAALLHRSRAHLLTPAVAKARPRLVLAAFVSSHDPSTADGVVFLGPGSLAVLLLPHHHLIAPVDRVYSPGGRPHRIGVAHPAVVLAARLTTAHADGVDSRRIGGLRVAKFPVRSIQRVPLEFLLPCRPQDHVSRRDQMTGSPTDARTRSVCLYSATAAPCPRPRCTSGCPYPSVAPSTSGTPRPSRDFTGETPGRT